MSRALTPVTIIASEFCQDIGDSTEFHHERYMKKLLRAYKNYIFRFLSPDIEIMTEIFPADSQIELPCDFVYETKIGLMKNGHLVTLDFNKDLRPSNRRYNDTQINTELNGIFDGSINPIEFYPYFNAVRNGAFVGEIYGAGSGYHANTWYNIHDGVLQLSSQVPDDTEVVVEYKSTGIKDGFKLIPDEMMEAINYKAKELFYEDSQPGLSDKMAVKFRTEYQKLKRLYNFRSPDFLAWIFKSYDRSSPH